MKFKYKKSALILSAISLFLLNGCMTLNPATGKKDFTPFMSPEKEDKMGKQAHPEILKQYGGENKNLTLKGYVKKIGHRLASFSEMKDKTFTFTILNSDVVNAFALPGGYIYVTRGMLSLFNSEAEMAAVIGHEIGHVTARHSAKRQSTSIFANLGAVLVGTLTKNNDIGRIAGQAAKLGIMSYSRGQEYQSDELGVRYSSRAGYDPYGASEMLKSLDAQHRLANILANKRNQKPRDDFFSTHPNTKDRVKRAYKAAQNTAIGENERSDGRRDYLNAINGMIYGDDPDRGLVLGRMFWHPSLRLTFTVPKDYKIQNGSTSVIARGISNKTKNAALIFSGGKIENSNLQNYIQKIWQGTVGKKAYLRDIKNIRINSMKAITGWAEFRQENTMFVARMVAIEFSKEQAFHFLTITQKNNNAALSQGLNKAVMSFRKLSHRESRKYKARRIKIITVKSGDTLLSLAQKMAFKSYKFERFLTLNGFTEQTILKRGSFVKIIFMDQ